MDMLEAALEVGANVPDANSRMEACQFLARAAQLRQAEGKVNLSAIEQCLNSALELDPENVEILREAAQFYNSVDADKARTYAALCRKQAEQIATEMGVILGESRPRSSAQLAARHIGGIIGPY